MVVLRSTLRYILENEVDGIQSSGVSSKEFRD